MTEQRRSLEEFVTANPNPPRIQAWLPNIPEFDAIKQAWLAGTATQSQIRQWLIQECGYTDEQATVARIAWLSKYQPRRPYGRS